MQKKLRTLPQKLLMVSKHIVAGMLLQCVLLTLLNAEDGRAQSVYKVPTHFVVQNQPLAEVFSLIEGQTDFNFTYSSQLNLAQRISLNGSEKNLGQVLEKLSLATHLTFRQINKILVVKGDDTKTTSLLSGTITGKVIDAQLSDRLPGATVKIAGSTIGTVTDVNGEFSLRAPEGEITLEITYIGFSKITQTVTVPANGVVSVEIKMNSNALELDNIIVTGILQGQQRALNQQKSADNIKNIVSADQMGRFPDVNVAEALQRVPAVNIERDQGEGRYLTVRGVSPASHCRQLA